MAPLFQKVCLQSGGMGLSREVSSGESMVKDVQATHHSRPRIKTS